METRTATIDVGLLKAASLCAGNPGERRDNLVSVNLEVSENQVIYVATDGHILFAVRAETELNTLIGSFTVPLETVKAIKPVRGNNYATLEGLTDKDNSLWLTLTLAGNDQSYGFRPITSSEYPDWRAVCPKDVPTDSYVADQANTDGTINRSMFDPNLLLKLWKVGKLIGCDEPDLSANGIGAAVVTFGALDNAFGLIMPMRRSGEPRALPAWIWNKPEEAVSKQDAA